MGYVTRTELKDWMRSTVNTAAEDVKRDRAIDAATQAINHHCTRDFTTTAGARVFDACSSNELVIDDAVTVTAIATDDNRDGTFETSWAASDYQLIRWNTPYPVGETTPYVKVRAVANRRFPAVTTTSRWGLIQVTGVWGWQSVPVAVKQACLILATRLVKRAESPEGIAGGFDEFGAVRISSKDDPDATRLLQPYRLYEVAIA